MNRIAVALALALVPWSVAQTVPNFSGIWELDPSRSTSSGQKPDKMVVKVEHQGNDLTVTFRVTRGGEIQQESQKYLIGQDSKTEMHGAPTATYWPTISGIVRSPISSAPSPSERLTSMMIGRRPFSRASTNALGIRALLPDPSDRLDAGRGDVAVGVTGIGVDVDAEKQGMRGQ